MWCGQPAWAGLTHTQVIFAVGCREEKLKPPENAPPEFAALVTRCMATEPPERPSFEEIAPEIERILSTWGPRAPTAAMPFTTEEMNNN